jgi:hypothetical protein
MTPYAVTSEGTSEEFKAGIHCALGALAVTAGLYNVMAYTERPAKPLAVNALVYLGLAVFEYHQVCRHVQTKEPV